MESKVSKFMPKKNQWLIVLLIGLLLAVIAIPTEKSVSDAEESYALDEELRLKNVLERMEGVGDVSIMITYSPSDKERIEGVVVIADGGGDSVIVRNITEVVQALFDVDSHKIKVIKGIKEN